MQITSRDIELLRWIQEQRFMSEKQIRKVFWPNISQNSREDYKRLRELQKAGCLKRNKNNIYRNVLYLVGSYGIKQLKTFGHCHGWNELYDIDYSTYSHDLAVTDLRVLFYQLGYRDWISERILSRRRAYRNLSDGMIYHDGNYFAIEYESSQKGKERYKEIFLHYALEQQVKAVIYVLGSMEMVASVSREAASYKKVYFTTFQQLQEHRLDAQIQANSCSTSLKAFLEGQNEARDGVTEKEDSWKNI